MSVHTIKQYLLVNMAPDMTKGKIAAACAHASMKVFFDRMVVIGIDNGNIKRSFIVNPIENEWISGSFAKIALKIPTEAIMAQGIEIANKLGVGTSIINDNGATQVEPGTVTCGAIGPFDTTNMAKYRELIDWLSQWKLY